MSPQEIIHNALSNIQTKANITAKWIDTVNKKGINGELNLEIENQTIPLFTKLDSTN